MDTTVAFLFHMYQPPWQDDDVLGKIVRECYGWFTHWLAEQRTFRATVNINYSLTELLLRHGHEQVIDNIGRGVENGSIELTGSAAYHGLLPLLPEREIWRQIELNERGNSKVFNEVWSPEGFFPPELAFSPDIARIAREMGYAWTLTDSVVYGKHNRDTLPHEEIACLDGIPLFFRADWSNKFAQEYPTNGWGTDVFVRDMAAGLGGWFGDKAGYACLAFDMETIGHHLHGFYDIAQMEQLVRCLGDHHIKVRSYSELLDTFPNGRVLAADSRRDYCGSWSTPFDALPRDPYPLWNHHLNETHKAQWDLLNYAIGLVDSLEDQGRVSEDDSVRKMLDRALNSCPFWWANIGRWNPDIIMEGAKHVYEVVREAAGSLQPDTQAMVLAEAYRLYSAVQLTVEGKPRQRGIVEARILARQ